MSEKSQNREIIEKQFNELFERARQLYPNIEAEIATYTNTAAATERLHDYLNLTMQTPAEVSNNHVVFS